MDVVLEWLSGLSGVGTWIAVITAVLAAVNGLGKEDRERLKGLFRPDDPESIWGEGRRQIARIRERWEAVSTKQGWKSQAAVEGLVDVVTGALNWLLISIVRILFALLPFYYAVSGRRGRLRRSAGGSVMS